MIRSSFPPDIKRLLDEYGALAYKNELRIYLKALQSDFAAWERGEIDAFQLEHCIHHFHNGPARELYRRYNLGYLNMNVAYAIVVGLLDRSQVPQELLEALSEELAAYEEEKALGNLVFPGEAFNLSPARTEKKESV